MGEEEAAIRNREFRGRDNASDRSEQEQLKLIASHLPVVLPGSLLVGMLLTWGFWDQVGVHRAVFWLSALVLLVLMRLLLVKWFGNREAQDASSRPLKLVLLGGSFAAGCLWGVAGPLFFDPENVLGFALLVITLGGVIAGSLGSHSYHFPNYVLFAVPVMMPLTLEFFGSDEEVMRLIGAIMVMFLLLNLYYSRRYEQMALRSIRLQFTNDALLQELRLSNEKLHRYSYTDSLTGIGNRRQFDVDFEAAWHDATQGGEALALILLDVDHFKVFNDIHGHPHGDEVLKSIACILDGFCRSNDHCFRPARIGGEEFALLLREGQQEAVELAEKLRQLIETEFAGGKPQNGITASFGIAAFPPDSSTTTQMQLFRQADEALYRAKNAGRNQVVSA